MKILKSVGAVIAGFIVLFVLSAGTDTILEKTGIFTPPDQGFFITWMIIVAIIYRAIYGVVGAYITAKFAPNYPIRHALALGIIGVILTFLGSQAMAGKSPEWFPVTLMIITLPCAWLGGKFAIKRT